jgi:hypothetical protein
MTEFWHEPEWHAAGPPVEHQEDIPGIENITSVAWTGWWYEGCPGI